MPVETIPLNETRIANKEPFTIRATDLYAWPEQPIVVEFDYNPQSRRWLWECRHEELGRLWPRGVATLDYPRSFYPFFGAKFMDTTARHEHVTTGNLGDDVVLAVYPGPRGGTFHPDSEMTEAEQDAFLGRHEWEPVR